MCRFIAYMGKPILLNEVLYKPSNSLIKQSIHAREAKERLNGDGFGIGWYNHDIDVTPAVYVSIQPAWNDRNLIHIAPRIRSGCFLAHVRAASNGSVSYLNCHPFYHNRFLFMHNGDIGGFSSIKRFLRRGLSDDIYNWIQGQTDSEHLFALFLDIFQKENKHYIVDEIMATLADAIKMVLRLQREQHITLPSYINAVVTDGNNTVAVRSLTHAEDEKAPTLYYSAGKYYECEDSGICHIHPSEKERGAVLIASEKLSGYRAQWHEIPVNHALLVSDDLSTRVVEFNVAI